MVNARKSITSQKMKFFFKDFFKKWAQIHGKLQIWSHLLKKSLMENFIFLCSVWNFQLKFCFKVASEMWGLGANFSGPVS